MVPILILLSLKVYDLYHLTIIIARPSLSTTSMALSPETKKRDADGCHHIFIDGGANIGVHGRFLLEPENYPDASVARRIFDAQFGALRDNRDFCVFEIEPNPAHYATLMNKSKAYQKMGWRYHVMNVGMSSQNGTLPFYWRNNEYAEEWDFSFQSFFFL